MFASSSMVTLVQCGLFRAARNIKRCISLTSFLHVQECPDEFVIDRLDGDLKGKARCLVLTPDS